MHQSHLTGARLAAEFILRHGTDGTARARKEHTLARLHIEAHSASGVVSLLAAVQNNQSLAKPQTLGELGCVTLRDAWQRHYARYGEGLECFQRLPRGKHRIGECLEGVGSAEEQEVAIGQEKERHSVASSRSSGEWAEERRLAEGGEAAGHDAVVLQVGRAVNGGSVHGWRAKVELLVRNGVKGNAAGREVHSSAIHHGDGVQAVGTVGNVPLYG